MAKMCMKFNFISICTYLCGVCPMYCSCSNYFGPNEFGYHFILEFVLGTLEMHWKLISSMDWRKCGKFIMKVASDVLLLLCLHDFGLRVTVEVGQASACLYSEARLYKGPSQSTLPQISMYPSFISFSLRHRHTRTHSHLCGLDLTVPLISLCLTCQREKV